MKVLNDWYISLQFYESISYCFNKSLAASSSMHSSPAVAVLAKSRHSKTGTAPFDFGGAHDALPLDPPPAVRYCGLSRTTLVCENAYTAAGRACRRASLRGGRLVPGKASIVTFSPAYLASSKNSTLSVCVAGVLGMACCRVSALLGTNARRGCPTIWGEHAGIRPS